MNNRHIYVLSAVLAALSLALFVYKSRVLGFPMSPQEETQIWNVEAALSFDPGPDGGQGDAADSRPHAGLRDAG